MNGEVPQNTRQIHGGDKSFTYALFGTIELLCGRLLGMPLAKTQQDE